MSDNRAIVFQVTDADTKAVLLSATLSGFTAADIGVLLATYKSLLRIGWTKDANGQDVYAEPSDLDVFKATCLSVSEGMKINVRDFVAAAKKEALAEALAVTLPVTTVS